MKAKIEGNDTGIFCDDLLELTECSNPTCSENGCTCGTTIPVEFAGATNRSDERRVRRIVRPYYKTPFFIGRTHFCTTYLGIWKGANRGSENSIISNLWYKSGLVLKTASKQWLDQVQNRTVPDDEVDLDSFFTTSHHSEIDRFLAFYIEKSCIRKDKYGDDILPKTTSLRTFCSQIKRIINTRYNRSID